MDLEKLWKSILAEVELAVSAATFKTHFAHTKLVSLLDNVATVGFINPMMRTLVEARYYSLLKSIFDHRTGSNVSLVFVVIPKAEQAATDSGPLFTPAKSAGDEVTVIAKKLHINPEFNFENFAVSTTNQLAYAAATAVAKNPAGAYNPLFFYGGVGVGKTHLMHAVANAILTKKSSTRLVYCMGEEFTNEIVEAIQTKSARQFRQKYRSAQLFLVDDVQFIAGKQQTQEEFFHTFNTVLREGGQVILTSDRPPGEIARLEERLRSRFEGGLIVDISPPDFELRAAIVNIKSNSLGLTLPSDCSQLVAANLTDARTIEGFLRRLITEVSATKRGVTPDLVSSLLKIKPRADSGPSLRRLTIEDVLSTTAQYFNLRLSALKGPRRDRPIVRPRQVVMYLCKTELGQTLDDIGGALGGRDHTTIMHGVEIITQELSTNQRLREAVEGIKQQLRE